MQVCTPDYEPQFHCLASACPSSCCIGWEVVVDEKTAAFYQTVPGAMGDRLRKSLCMEDGERCFRRRNRRCPFLDEKNLCEIHRQLGECRTSETCRCHPRFAEEFGALREISLAASCPAAARLLLGSREPLTFRNSGEAAEPWSDPWIPPLLTCRAKAMEILQDRSRPLWQRTVECLLLANQAQTLLDQEAAEELPTLCREWGLMELPAGLEQLGGEPLLPGLLELLGEMEILEPDWPELLCRAQTTPAPPLEDDLAERILCYFLFRYFLKAVTDGDLLSRVQFAVCSLLTVNRLAGSTGDAETALYRYCREMEHSEENLAQMREAFCEDLRVDLGRCFAALYQWGNQKEI